MNIVLFGFKSCGKSSTGILVARKLHKTFVDVDRVIEDIYFNPLLGRTKSLTASEIYLAHGEEFFRALERDAVRKLRLIKRGVIAAGGGAVLDYYNHAELKKNAVLVYLEAPKEVLRKRVLAMQPPPGFLDREDLEGSFERIYDERISIYERVADVTVATDELETDAIAEKVCILARD